MKTSLKFLLILFVVMLISISAIIIKVHNDFQFEDTSSVFSEKEMSLSSFHRIEADGRINITYTQDTFQRVIVKADSNMMRSIHTEVKDGKLFINFQRNYRVRRPVEVVLTTDSLNEVILNAGSSFEGTKRFRSTGFVGKAAAGSNFRMDCAFSSLSMELNAGSDAKLSGECSSLTLDASAGSEFKANDLLVQNAIVHANAGSTVKVNAIKTLEVHANSGSNVYYKGHPQLTNVDISSGGNLKQFE